MRAATLYKQLDDGRYVAYDPAAGAYMVVPPEHVPPLAPVRLSFNDDHPREGSAHDGKRPGEFAPKGGEPEPLSLTMDPWHRAKKRAAGAGRKSPTGLDRLNAAWETHYYHLNFDVPSHEALGEALGGLDEKERPDPADLDAVEHAAKAVGAETGGDPDERDGAKKFARHVLAGVSAARKGTAVLGKRKAAWMKVARRLAGDLAAAHDAWIGQWSFTQTGEPHPGDMGTQAHRLWWPLHQVARAGATPSPAMVKDLRVASAKLTEMGGLPPKLAAAVAAVQKATSPKRVPMRLSHTAVAPRGDGGRKHRALLLLAMLEFQRRAHAVGMPDAAKPYLDHLAKLAGDPAAARKAVRLSLHAAVATTPAYQPPPATDPAPYGYCPECRSPATHTERRPDGNAGCANGHTFPAKRAKFSYVGVPLGGDAAGRLLALGATVRTEDLADDGREAEPHVTVRYGLHTADPADVLPFVQGSGPARLWLGKVSVFRGAEKGAPFDVLKVDVDSPDLRRLNAALKALPHTDTHPEYQPHATIAYVKAGLGDAYAAAMPPLDLEVTVPEAEFSTPAWEKSAVRLSWRAEPYTDGRARRYQFRAVGEGPDQGRVLYGADAQNAIARQQQRGTQAQEYDQQAAAVTGRQPAPDAHPEQGYSHKEFKAKSLAAYKAASAVASLAVGREDITGDHLRDLAGHLPYLTAAQLRSVRVRLNTAFDVSFGGKSRRAEMVGSVMNHVRAELDRMDKEAGTPVVDAPRRAALDADVPEEKAGDEPAPPPAPKPAAPAPAGEKPGYHIYQDGKFVPVNGKPLDLLGTKVPEGFEFFTHQDKDGDWRVYESRSGMGMDPRPYSTRKVAEDSARGMLRKYGGKLADAIENVTRKNGVSPRHAAPAATPDVSPPTPKLAAPELAPVLAHYATLPPDGPAAKAIDAAVANASPAGHDAANPPPKLDAKQLRELRKQLGHRHAELHGAMSPDEEAGYAKMMEAVGVKSLHAPGETKPFDPETMHSDSGMATGTPVKVTRRGWTGLYGDAAVGHGLTGNNWQRAAVEPAGKPAADIPGAVRGGNPTAPEASRAAYGKATPADRAAVRKYTGDDHEAVNQYLRGVAPGTPEIKAVADAVARVIDAVPPFPAPVTVYRSVSGKGFEGGAKGLVASLKTAAASGEPVEYKGFVSTTTDWKQTQGFNSDVIFEIAARKGLDTVPYAQEHNHKEAELLLPHASRFRITGVERRVHSLTQDDYWHVTAEQIVPGQSETPAPKPAPAALDNANTTAKVEATPQPAGPTDGELLGSTGGEADGLPARQRVGGAAAEGAVAGEGEGAGAGPGAVPAGADEPGAGPVRTAAGPGDATAGGTGTGARRPARRRRVAEPGVDRDPGTGARLGGGLDGTAPAIPDPSPADAAVAEEPGLDNPTDAAAGNYRYHDREFVKGGPRAKFQANLAAVRTLRQIQSEGRTTATPEEQAILAKFTGWGQFPGVFNDFWDNSDHGRTFRQKLEADGLSSAEWEQQRGEWAKERDALKGLMSPEEWEAAKRSTLNAHYTHPDIVDAHWQAAQRLGFSGGRFLETSAGVGYYLGMMPPDLAGRTRATAVEMDPTTGGMLKHLYPSANVLVQGFQKEHGYPDNHYDLVASNVPFGGYTVHDPKYNRHKANIHDYFFLKSADKVRPGGLVMHITSTGTLDKADPKVREELYKTHDLVAAIRFPGAAHKENAGTDVVTDMVVLRKRLPGEEPGDRSWVETTTVPDPDGGDPIPVNSYFAKNPDQILGRLDRTGTMYQGESSNVSLATPEELSAALGRRVKVAVDDKGKRRFVFDDGAPVPRADIARVGGEAFKRKLAAAVGRLPQGALTPSRAPAKRFEPAVLPAPGEVKDGGFHLQDGKVFVREGSQLTEQKVGKDAAKLIGAHLTVRDAYRAVVAAERAGGDAGPERAALNAAYDKFVKQHGPLSAPKNRRLFATDPDAAAVLSLEKYDQKAKTAAKADIFTKPVVRSAPKVEKVGSVAEGLGVTLHENGRLDIDHIARLTGQKPAAVGKELVAKGLAYEDPSHGWEPAAHYLSGNVRQKLAAARAAAAGDPRFDPNVAALEKVQPEDIPHDEIDARLGSPWVPPGDVAAFAGHLMQAHPGMFEVKYNGLTGEWAAGFSPRAKYLSRSALATSTWGTAKADFADLLEAALNNRPIRITYPAEKGEKPVVDREATDAANDKAAEIKEEFGNWLWADDDRRERLHRHYNDNFNNIRNLKYDGSHLSMPGSNPAVELRPHQKDFIWRVVTTGRGLAGHEVGTGKTFSMIGAAMELRRLGLARKPAILAKKANVDAITRDALHMYPGAKILSTADMFDAAKRKQTIARIATGDYDMIVMTHDHFDMLPVRPEVQERFIRAELAELEAAREEAWQAAGKKGDAITKQLDKAKAKLEARLEKSLAADKKDDAAYFEDLGIDQIFVDEAQRYKTLPVYTKMRGIKGVPTGRSQRATGMQMKAQWLQQQNGGRGVVFATGTPISNTMVELYNMQRFLQPDELAQRGIKSFDAWANTFGDVVTKHERTATGDYKPVARFARFVNVPELMSITRQMMDVQRADDLKKPDGTPVVKRPKRADKAHVAPASEGTARLMADLKERAEALKKQGGPPTKGADNMLKICTDGRKGSIDLRLVYANAPDAPDSKANLMVGNVLKIAKANPGQVQMVFTDLARTNELKLMSGGDTDYEDDKGEDGEETPGDAADAGRTDKGGFDLMADVVAKLVKGGIPRDKILDFRALEGKKKDEAVERLKAGDAMVAIGGTDTLGTGVNAQDKLLAIHHLDCPWRPADLEQRDGRGWRHGNSNAEVQIHKYVTEKSLDEMLWQGIARKSGFIRQAMTTEQGKARNMAEIDTEELSPEAIMAAASGDPRILRRVELDEDVRKLANAEKRHAYGLKDVERRVRNAEDTERDYSRRIADYKDAVQTVSGDQFHMRVGSRWSGKEFAERTPEARAEIDQYLEAAENSTYQPVASYKGLDVYKDGGRYYFRTPGGAKVMATTTGSLAAIEHAARNRLRTELEAEEGSLSQFRKDTDARRAMIGQAFPKAAELASKREELKKLTEELAGKKDEPPAGAPPAVEPPSNSGDPGDSGDDSAGEPARPYYQQRGGKFVETPDAKPVKLDGHDGHEFFVAQDDAGTFEVVETRSGLAVARGAGEAEAVRKAAETLDRNKERLAAVIDAAVAKSGPSPRHAT